MHTEQQHAAPPTGRSENAAEMWERLCDIWDAAMQRAQKTGDSSQAARAELTLGICKRERSRVADLFRITTRA